MNRVIIDPNTVMLSNQGYIKINEIEIAELKDIKVWFEVETAKVDMIGIPQRGEVITDVQGKLSFSMYKIYSRFKTELINCYKEGRPFYFALELTTQGRLRDTNGNMSEEDISIGLCWLDKDITIAELNADADLLNESFEGGFMVASLKYEANETWDKNEWNQYN